MFFVTQPPSADEFRAALEKRTWPEGLSDLIMFPALWGTAEAATGSGALSVTEFIDVLGDCHPNLKPRIPFFLLGALNRIVSDEIDLNVVSGLLRTLESVKDAEVDRTWLKQSTEFVRNSLGLDIPFDLLVSSLTTLNRIEKYDGMDLALVSNVRDYLRKLKTIRDQGLVRVQEPKYKE